MRNESFNNESFNKEETTGKPPEILEGKEGYVERLKKGVLGVARIITLATALGLPLKGLEAGEKNISPQEPTVAENFEETGKKILNEVLKELEQKEIKPSLTKKEAAFEVANIIDSYIYSSEAGGIPPDPRLLELAEGIKGVYNLTPQELEKGENEYKEFRNEQIKKGFKPGISLSYYRPSFAPQSNPHKNK